MQDIGLRRLPLVIRPDPARVLVRPFLPATVPHPPPAGPVHPAIEPSRANPSVHPATEPCRMTRITRAVLAMDPAQVEAELAEVMRGFGDRHPGLRETFADRFAQVRSLMAEPPGEDVDEARRLLVGAYFSLEYSFQAAALFNPSVVPAPHRDGLPPGQAPFVLSLRATGEGHVSSLCFRSGTVDAAGEVTLDPPATRAVTPRLCGPPDADGGCAIAFPPGSALAERVLFPITPQQRGGIEDARFVRFTEDDGRTTHYATYTAYSGHDIVSELLQTDDFRHFRILPLRGDAVHNKGMALFPRRVAGQYLMLNRADGETVQLSRSTDLRTWNGTEALLAPSEPWNLLQMGNCGSPVELPEGWLVLTHGVGPMRRYCLGAALLDLHDPARVLRRLRTPLLSPGPAEREGYVPNVVYSCGAIVHAGRLLLPYAMSDSATGFATVPVRDLLAAMA